MCEEWIIELYVNTDKLRTHNAVCEKIMLLNKWLIDEFHARELIWYTDICAFVENCVVDTKCLDDNFDCEYGHASQVDVNIEFEADTINGDVSTIARYIECMWGEWMWVNRIGCDYHILYEG